MKIIDLLNLLYEEKAPKKIKYSGFIYEFNLNNNCYEEKFTKNSLGYNYKLDSCLNDEVEIIEEIEKPKKIEKIQIYNREDSKTFQYSIIPEFMSLKETIQICNENFERHQEIIYMLANTLNEAIDKLNHLLEKSDKNVI